MKQGEGRGAGSGATMTVAGGDDEPPSRFSPETRIKLDDLLSVANLPEWRNLLGAGIAAPEAIAARFGLDPKAIKTVTDKYPALINHYYLSLIKEKDDPIYRQSIPAPVELEDEFGESDPLHEEPENQVRTGVPCLITHRYPDRALFRISNQCAMYCRFCTRKRKVGDLRKQPTRSEIEAGLEYIKEHTEIRDVILSGGDPLMLSDTAIERILREVHSILKDREFPIIRIGTRIPCVLPQRITPKLCRMLKRYHPLYINTHFNHPDEITPFSRQACELLVDAGIPVGNQTVLLKGVNDDPEVMIRLVRGLVAMRVKPYYIFQADPVKGTNHFRTRVKRGLDIYRALRGHTSGLAVPTYVIDAPGGGGKIPLLPQYLKHHEKDRVVLCNYEGKEFIYPDTAEE